MFPIAVIGEMMLKLGFTIVSDVIVCMNPSAFVCMAVQCNVPELDDVKVKLASYDIMELSLYH
jgi:hypothetical protein